MDGGREGGREKFTAEPLIQIKKQPKLSIGP